MIEIIWILQFQYRIIFFRVITHNHLNDTSMFKSLTSKNIRMVQSTQSIPIRGEMVFGDNIINSALEPKNVIQK